MISDGALAASGAPESQERDGRWQRAIDAAIRRGSAPMVFQPIVDLARGEVAGYEALARFRSTEVSASPDVWFAEAARRGCTVELDEVAVRSALASRLDLPTNTFVSINVEPESLLSPAVVDLLVGAGGLAGVVLEVTEHRSVPASDLRPVLDRLRSEGAMVALDDTGAGHAGLTQVLDLRPSILKLDKAIVGGIARDEAKAAMVEMVGTLANRIDAWVLAEGVESAADLDRLVGLGVPLGQGFLLGRPGDGWGVPSAAVRARMARARGDQRSLKPLLDDAPHVLVDDIEGASACLAAGDDRLVVVLDANLRPLGVVTPESALSGYVIPTLKVNHRSSPIEVAHRLSTWAGDPSVPVTVTDRAGQHLGVLTIRTLLAAVARSAEAATTG